MLYVKFSLLIFLIAISKASFGATLITIQDAKWGTKDVTAAAKNYCDNKEQCNYKVSSKYIGQHEGPAKNFSMSWTCGNKADTASLPEDAENQFIRIKCKQDKKTAPAAASLVLTKNTAKVDQDTVDLYSKILTEWSGGRAIKLEEFTKTFFPIPDAPLLHNDMPSKCHNNEVAGECSPDTYYSWGPSAKLNLIKAKTASNHWNHPLNDRQFVYMSHTPAATYCYGRHPVRFKFKKNFYPQRGPLKHPSKLSHGFNEWIFATGMDIESVSYAQPEHIDELIIEIQRRLDSKSSWHKTAMYVPPYLLKNLKEKLIWSCVPEVLQLNEKNLVDNVLTLIKSFLNGKSWIHFQDCPTCTKKTHFQTDWPSFYNPK